MLPFAAANHVQRVLRLRAGATLVLFNGRGGEYSATLLRAERAATVAAVGELVVMLAHYREAVEANGKNPWTPASAPKVMLL